jgi:hypothetical protein
MAADRNPSRGEPHIVICEAETPSEALFVCTDYQCGRRVVVGKSPPRLTVLNRGDFFARHVGGSGGVVMRYVAVG